MLHHRSFQPSDLQAYCLDRLGAVEDFPFGPKVAAYRVKGKIFALAMLDGNPFQFNLKCDPEYARVLRQNYSQIIPGYHLNKRHWNSIRSDGTLPLDLIHGMINHSYDIIASHSRSVR